MFKCPRCSASLSESGRFCPSCGAAQPAATVLVPESNPDWARTVPVAPEIPTRSSAAGTTAVSRNDARFIPGAMVTDRYRIVGLLGHGGMGEVYRADDLKLGQPVALKFLPPELAEKPGLLDRFLNEVRTALKVTHPNVCRVYDIGEVDGQHFLSMEFVDGEDLASLLRRIGRMPEERAVEVARQICAGLAAAHEQGILHRDMKPANVMIDGRGQARLTDFGLAAIADSISQDDVSSGTPGYMAPEQIAGQEVTVRSDIYGLGLVLYELFTGRPVFEGRTAAELTRHHASSIPSSPTVYVESLDPAVERAVLRCLEKNPADRPASVLAVSSALPGGDPLAAALAAGETPSPELVAEAGERRGMSPPRAILLAMVAILLVVGGTRWAGNMTITNYLNLERQPEVLEDRARSIIAGLGYGEEVYAKPADHAWGLITWNTVMTEVVQADTTGSPWEGLRTRPDAVSYWYRQSPRTLLPTPNNPPIFQRGDVTLVNPPATTAGEITVLLDGAGRLRRFEAIPTRYSTADTVAEADWDQLFALAGLDTARFTGDRPRYQRFLAPDRRRAWIGTHIDQPEVELWVEAGSYEGRTVLFNVAAAAGLESLGRSPALQERNLGWYISFAVQPLIILLIVFLSVRTAISNLKQGRADRRGGFRFGVLSFTLFMFGTGLQSHALFTEQWAEEIWPILVGATFVGMSSWSLYTAAEPLGRQVWPTMFVSSSRLLSRPRLQWLDPLLGQSVLSGFIGGALSFLIMGPIRMVLTPLWTGEPANPFLIDTALLQNPRYTLGFVLDQSLLLTFLLIFVVSLVFIRKMIRRLPVALAVGLVLWTILNGVDTLETLAFSFIASAIMMVLLLRWGVVAMVVSRVVGGLAWQARAADWTLWHAESAVLILLILTALAIYGGWAAMGSRQHSD